MGEAPPILRGFTGEAAVLARLARAGLPAVYTEEKPPFFPFHGAEGCWFVHGVLYYGPQTDADTFAHEACHALLLAPEERAVWGDRDTETSEPITMALQVELWRGIRGAGVRRAHMVDAMKKVSVATSSRLTPYVPNAIAPAPPWLGGGEVQALDHRHGHRFALFNGDCVEVMRQLPDACLDLTVYSPPFAGLYIYSDSPADMGNCADDEQFLRQYRYAVEEKYRLTRPGRLSAVHCKDLRNLQGTTGRSGLRDFQGKIIEVHQSAGWEFHTRITLWRCPVKQQATSKGSRLNYKDLMRDATFSMMGTPEYLLIFRRWAETEAEKDMVLPVPHDPEEFPLPQWQTWASPVWGYPPSGDSLDETDVLGGEKDSADEKHICPLPMDITRRVVRMWSNPGDVVGSPFAGIGSEGVVALQEGRRSVGIELKASYFKQNSEWLDGIDRQMGLF